MSENQQEFIKAIQSGNRARVKEMLASDGNLVDSVDENGLSAVLTAIYYGQPGIASGLIAGGARLNVFDCAAAGQLPALRQLVEERPELVNAFAPDGFQPLGLSAFFGQLNVVEFLLEKGADVNSAAKNRLNVMPLHSAVANSQMEIALLLLEHGADVNARQEEGFTSLHEAAQNGNVGLVLLLLEYGADRQAKMSGGLTAADLARQAGYLEVAGILEGSLNQ